MKLKYKGKKEPVFDMSYLEDAPYKLDKEKTITVSEGDGKILLEKQPGMFSVIAVALFKCDICGKEYKAKDSLTRHIKKEHPNG